MPSMLSVCPGEVEHALSISRPAVALVSAAVAQQPGVAEVLRAGAGLRSILVWGGEAAPEQSASRGDLPDGIASLEQMMVSPAK